MRLSEQERSEFSFCGWSKRGFKQMAIYDLVLLANVTWPTKYSPAQMGQKKNILTYIVLSLPTVRP